MQRWSGNPAATVTTSSPGCSRRSPSFGDVNVLSATRFADEPEFTSRAFDTSRVVGKIGLELLGKTVGGEEEVQTRIDDVGDLVGVEHSACVVNQVRRWIECAPGELLLVVLLDQRFNPVPQITGFRHAVSFSDERAVAAQMPSKLQV